jgi:hypothetical protein
MHLMLDTPVSLLLAFPAQAGIHAGHGHWPEPVLGPTSGRTRGPARREWLAVLAVIAANYQRSTLPSSAEILGHRPLGERNNSRVLAVTPLFFAVLVNSSQRPGGALALRTVSLGEIRMCARISQTPAYYQTD